MSGTGLKDLAFPDDKHRVDLLDPTFETEKKKRSEQEERRRLLREAAALATSPKNARQALRLSSRLNTSIEPVRQRCSSPVYLRAQKILIVGALLKLFDLPAGERGTLRAITLLPGPRWRVTPNRLKLLDARKLCRALRAALRRAGATSARGFLICFVEAEYNSYDGTLHLHFHGFALGDMVAVVNRLREQRNFGHDRAVHIEQIRQNLPHALSYPLKFWKAVYRAPDGVTGRPQRIPEPTHSQTLLWLDRYTVTDLSVMIGGRVDKFGQIKPTNMCTNKDDHASE